MIGAGCFPLALSGKRRSVITAYMLLVLRLLLLLIPLPVLAFHKPFLPARYSHPGLLPCTALAPICPVPTCS
jgi:hypothetical protein